MLDLPYNFPFAGITGKNLYAGIHISLHGRDVDSNPWNCGLTFRDGLQPSRARRPSGPPQGLAGSAIDTTGLLQPTHYGNWQVKFAASSILPVPRYFATCGYGHKGRVLSTLPSVRREAVIIAGAWPFSTHCSSAAKGSNALGPSPPPQCAIPGTRNNRSHSPICPAPTVSRTLS